MGYDGRYVQCARPLQNGRWTIKLKIVWSAAAHKPTLIKSAVNGMLACTPTLSHRPGYNFAEKSGARDSWGGLGEPDADAGEGDASLPGAAPDAVADADHHRPLLSHHTLKLWCIIIIPDMAESEREGGAGAQIHSTPQNTTTSFWASFGQCKKATNPSRFVCAEVRLWSGSRFWIKMGSPALVRMAPFGSCLATWRGMGGWCRQTGKNDLYVSHVSHIMYPGCAGWSGSKSEIDQIGWSCSCITCMRQSNLNYLGWGSKNNYFFSSLLLLRGPGTPPP